MKQLHLGLLSQQKIPGLSVALGNFLAEAIAVCLSLNHHSNKTIITIEGSVNDTYQITWSDNLSDDILGSWKDLKEATEYAACGLALLLVDDIMRFKNVTRNIGAADYIISDVALHNHQKSYPVMVFRRIWYSF
jgi:hypothetical protein